MVDSGTLGVVPTPNDGTRRARKRVWDESTRPSRPRPADPVRYTPRGRAAAAGLKQVHDELRAELAKLDRLVDRVTRREIDPKEARLGLAEMVVRQQTWTLGAYCQSYCRFVASHHIGEDVEIFPVLRTREVALGPIIDRLQHEHITIHGLLDDIDAALVRVVGGASTFDDLCSGMDLLSDALLSHLAWEEAQLLEAFGRWFG